MNKKSLIARWKDESFLRDRGIYLSSLKEGKAEVLNADLAGVSIGVPESPADLLSANLYGAVMKNTNLSFAHLACSLSESSMEGVLLCGATLDRCLFRKAQLRDCDLSGAKLIVSLDDSVLNGCRFDHAKFLSSRSGHEFGGRRVKFVGCSFCDAQFKGVEFRASSFIDCNFHGAKFIGCDFRGVKLQGGIMPTSAQFEKMDPPEGV